MSSAAVPKGQDGVQIITFKGPRATDGIGPVNEGVDPPRGRVRRGRGGTDKALSKLLCEAIEDLGRADCTFWACEGPSRPKHMVTCVKCWAMRNVVDVLATLQARAALRAQPGQAGGGEA